MNDPQLSCRDEHRRDDVRAHDRYGLDFVELGDDDCTLRVVFLGKAPARIEKASVRITGGRRIRDVGVVRVHVHHEKTHALDDFMEVQVDKSGDFSTYTLSVVQLDADGHPTDEPLKDFDRRYSSVEFSFKAGCPTDLDCKTEPVCPPPLRTLPEINYLAKDYASFRQLILDRLALVMPAWRERHVPDLGITLVEILAYVGDYLSYYQDAVATEAYLGTARQRISVRRHARLVDYAMHEGCNARAWITIWTDSPAVLSFDPSELFFVTAFPRAPDVHVLRPHDLERIPAGSYDIFEPLVEDDRTPILIYAAHSEIHFYTWGDDNCCLARGATSATLLGRSGSRPEPPVATVAGRRRSEAAADPSEEVGDLHLRAGDVLIFEEIRGPKTGNEADADPKHRQAVRLTKVTPGVDELYDNTPIVEIEWSTEDALTFPLCISAQAPPPDCTSKEISVARGNVILVDNGSRVGEPLGTVPTESTLERCPTDCEPGETVTVAGLFRPTLKGRPLTFRQPLLICGSATARVAQDPRQALPDIAVVGTQATADGHVETAWSPKRDLLESGAGDPDFVVEMDNDGAAHLRFGNDDSGRMPDAGTVFAASYRVGNGTSANVGAETITYMVLRRKTLSGVAIAPRNPLPATGGTAPEPIQEVKLFAPDAFRKVLERAITAADYATLAEDDARRLRERAALVAAAGAESDLCFAPFRKVQHAKATLRWTGSWYEALVAIDPLGTEEADPELLEEITAYLEPYRRVGHDLVVKPARYAALDLAMSVCVLPHYLRGHVEAALLDVLSNRVLRDGSLGFFHPDNSSFGEGIYVSRIVAAAQAVPGVQNVQVTRLERYEIDEPPLGTEKASEELPAHAVLALGPFEIARLDNDPSFPENGRLLLDVRGGR